MTKAHNEKYMKRAIELALNGWGKTSPNPLVGAVVVKNGRIIGEGYHRKAGSEHAEITALRKAGQDARGADLYVTLEPCCHHGRTPPCIEFIVSSGVRRVVIGAKDPNLLVNGKGIKELKRAGLDVRTGVLRDACREINRPYEKFIVQGTPFVILKAALSLDGKIATQTGDSKWITGDSCREYVHRLRSGVDAILVGGGTIRKDDPQLNVRLPSKKHQSRLAVVIDESLDLPRNSRIFKRTPGELILATTTSAPKNRIEWARDRGYKVLVCRSNRRNFVLLPHLMEELGKRDITSVLVEGGGAIFADFISHKLVDHIVACVAPKFIGSDGKDFLPGVSIGSINEVLKLRGVTVRTFGDDVVIEGSFFG